MLDDIAKGFVRIFSPPKDDAPNGNWAGTGSGFTGRIDHHGKGRPFKDGFSAAAAATKEATTEAVDAASDVAEGRGNEAVGYVEGAVKGVMDKNFASKDDENPSTGAQGWKGDIHGRGRDGFHVPRG